jgi:diguanylate cyclase (GGDEF)-like protein
MSIVVIDPNRHELEQCAAMLGRWGYNQTILCASLEEAQDVLGLGEQALRTIFGLELIVIDISHGDAFAQFVDRIRSMLFYQDIPILATSDGSRAEKMPLAFAFGATDFVSKPIEEFELRARVRSCLRLKHEIDRRKAREKELLEATHQLSDLNQILAKMSLLDSLTAIPNRRCFDESLEQEWKRAFRNGGNLALILCDIDYFKQYNDTYGHQRGDHCLQKVAQAVKSALKRPGDLVARYGGEEFAIILPHTTALQAANICNNIRTTIRELGIEHSASQVSPFVTLSMGVASTEPSVTKMSTEMLLSLSDAALYVAKQQGRDQFQIARDQQQDKTA